VAQRLSERRNVKEERMSLTQEERAVFEELLRAGQSLCYKSGQSLAVVLPLCANFTKAANRAERVLDALRTPAERTKIENAELGA
jgi:hypothetical protein